MSSARLTGLDASDPMIDALDRVSGRTRYAIDVRLPGMAHAALVRSDRPSGRIVALDTDAARNARGVIRVITGADVVAAGLDDVRFGTMARDQPLLAASAVACNGDAVAAVVADTAGQARAAAASIGVQIEAGPAVFDPDDALEPDAPLVHAGRADNVLGRWHAANGDLASAKAAARRHFRHEFRTPAAQHASLEPHVCVAQWEDGRLETWTTSQNPSRVAEELVRIFGLGEDGVRLHVPSLGGAYGGKNHAKHEPLVALLARLVGRPVRLANRREDEFVTVTKHPARILVESGIDDDGRIAYRSARLRWSGGAYALSSLAVMRAGGIAVLGPYRIPAAEVESIVVYTNLPPAGSFRGLGVNQAAWAGERQIDIIAAELGIDPVEFRRRNLVRPGDRLWTGEPAGDAHWLECLERVVEEDGGASRTSESPRSAQGLASPNAERDTRRGRGVAVVMKHTITPSRSEATVALLPDGVVEVRTSAVDMGQGAPTVLARIAGRVLGVGIDRIRTVLPDTAITPFDATSSSSRLTFAAGEAVERAAHDLLDRLLERASRALGVPPERLTRAAGATAADDGRVAEDAVVVGASGVPELVGSATFVNEPVTDPDTGRPVSSSHWHQGALAVNVAVDIATGVVRVERARGAAWAGEVVSNAGARLQNEGNVIFGLGQALWERLEFGPQGQPQPATFLDYRLPSILDVPDVLETHALEGAADQPRERHGLGESLIPAVAPAVGNAVADATGASLSDLPLLPERVRAAIEGAGRETAR
jgi:CO/xanthine dehydrogenase Mo-binding subunit